MRNLLRHLTLVAAILAIGAVAGSCEAGFVIPTPAGLVAGDTFRIVFQTDGAIDPSTSTNIVDYNNFVTAQAGGATYNGSVVNWLAIGSTSSVNAIDNVGQTTTPVYLANGTLVTTSTSTTGLWSGSLLAPIDEDLTGTVVGNFVWTGTNPNGTVAAGSELGVEDVEFGSPSASNSDWVSAGQALGTGRAAQMYGISQVLTVGGAVPEPASLVMLGMGAVGVLGYSRIKRRASKGRGEHPAEFLSI